MNLTKQCLIGYFKQIKKNVLLLQGPPNTGKSYTAREFWKIFTIHTRLVQDGIFTFQNLINSDCALWEEPMITNENVDTTKLILEGEKDVSIAIKNQATQKLHKRIPIIITTNKPLYQYCSSEQQALNARCYKFYTHNIIDKDDVCDKDNHYCNISDTGGYPNPLLPSSELLQHLSDEQQEENRRDCKPIHPIERFHCDSYFIWLLNTKYENNTLQYPSSFDENTKLHCDFKLLDLKNRLCETCNSNAYIQ